MSTEPPEGRVLVAHRLCRVSRHGPHRLEARTALRPAGLIAAGALGSAGLAPLVIVPLLGGGPGPGQLMGLPFVGLSWLYFRNLSRSWGLVVIDNQEKTVRFTQGDELVGSWPLSAVTGLREGLAFSHTWRSRVGQDRWLKLAVGGRELPLLLGYPEELDAVRSILRAWGVSD